MRVKGEAAGLSGTPPGRRDVGSYPFDDPAKAFVSLKDLGIMHTITACEGKEE